MLSPLGMVGVAAVTVVKVAAVLGMAYAGYHVASAAVGIYFGGGEAVYAKAMEYGLGFLAGWAGFELSQWADGNIRRLDAKDQQEEALRRCGALAR